MSKAAWNGRVSNRSVVPWVPPPRSAHRVAKADAWGEGVSWGCKEMVTAGRGVADSARSGPYQILEEEVRLSGWREASSCATTSPCSPNSLACVGQGDVS